MIIIVKGNMKSKEDYNKKMPLGVNLKSREGNSQTGHRMWTKDRPSPSSSLHSFPSSKRRPLLTSVWHVLRFTLRLLSFLLYDSRLLMSESSKKRRLPQQNKGTRIHGFLSPLLFLLTADPQEFLSESRVGHQELFTSFC